MSEVERVRALLESSPHALLSPREVAVLFGVNAKTVTRWARVGKIAPVFTLGGHRRYRASEVKRLLAAASGGEGGAVGGGR